MFPLSFVMENLGISTTGNGAVVVDVESVGAATPGNPCALPSPHSQGMTIK